MSNFVNLDSISRDREQYPNPFDYELTPQQVNSWFPNARTVNPFPKNPSTQPIEFVTTINVQHLILPYNARFATLPIVYLNFRSRNFKDIHLIQTIAGAHPEVNFICEWDKVQSDDNGTPLWIHYKCHMEQTVRFTRDFPIIFQITTRDGNPLPGTDTLVPLDPDPLQQSLCTFEITTYLRDGDYDNHLIEPLTT